MASTKQCRYISVLARKLGKKVEFEELKKLEPQAASEMIDDMLQKMTETKGKPAKEEKKQAQTINKVRFGMACKIVLKETPYKYFLENREEFNIRTAKVYEMLQDAEQELEEPDEEDEEEIIPSPDFSDYLTEAAMDQRKIKEAAAQKELAEVI